MQAVGPKGLYLQLALISLVDTLPQQGTAAFLQIARCLSWAPARPKGQSRCLVYTLESHLVTGQGVLFCFCVPLWSSKKMSTPRKPLLSTHVGEGSGWAHPGTPWSWDYIWSSQGRRRVISSHLESKCGYGRAYGFTIVSWRFFFLSLSPRRQLLSFSRDEMCAGVILDAEIHTYFPLAASAKL